MDTQTNEIPVDDMTQPEPTPAEQAMGALQASLHPQGEPTLPVEGLVNPLAPAMVEACSQLRKLILAKGIEPELLEAYSVLVATLR